MRSLRVFLSGAAIIILMAGCQPAPAPTVEPETALPPAQPTVQDVTLEQGEQAATPSPAATLIPTPPAPIPTWPLAADLFYLTAGGQVWRQPAGGGSPAAVTRQDIVVQDFALAPGGDWLIYRSENAVIITSLDGRQGQVIAQEVPLPGGVEPAVYPGVHSVSWSPDASRLAFVTPEGFQVFVPGAGEDFEPVIFPAAENPLRGVDWSPDSRWLLALRADSSAVLYSADPLIKWADIGRLNGHAWLDDSRLAFAPVEGGLALITPGSIDSRVFLVPQDRQVTLPGQQADGTLAFFSHNGSIGQPGYLNIANPADLSFRPEGTAPIITTDRVWDPSGKRLLGPGPEPSTLAVIDPATGAAGSIESAGDVLGYDWGSLPPQAVSGLPMTADLYYLAPQAGITQVWRLPANAEAPRSITQAASDILAFDVSADKTWIIYAAGGSLWRAGVGGADATELLTLNPNTQGEITAPAISPDGGWIAFVENGILIHELETGTTRRLATDRLPQPGSERLVQVYREPRWSPDGAWLLVTVGFYEGSDLALIPVDETLQATIREPLLLELFGADAHWLESSRLIAFSRGSAYSDPFVAIVQPGNPPALARLLNVPTLDARLRNDGRLALLRARPPRTEGPPVVRLFSALISGSDLRPETGSFVLNQAQLSPGGDFIAGLIQPLPDEAGSSGQLAIISSQRNELVVIAGAAGAHGLRWVR